MYFHGNGEDIFLGYELLDHLRYNLKINVVAVEYPGYGLYKGNPSEEVILEDSQLVMEFLIKKLKIPPENIIIMGRSIGSGPATYVASKYKVGSLVLISAFTSLRAVVS